MSDTHQDTVLDSVLGAIGNTPLVELSRITRGLDIRILAKLEYLNPGYSKQDHIPLKMIEHAAAELSVNDELRLMNCERGLRSSFVIRHSP